MNPDQGHYGDIGDKGLTSATGKERKMNEKANVGAASGLKAADEPASHGSDCPVPKNGFQPVAPVENPPVSQEDRQIIDLVEKMIANRKRRMKR